jgi:hypothetical protein
VIVPAYGPNWRYKVPKMNPSLWHIQGIHYPKFKRIRMAPWNARRKRKKS